MLFRNQFANKHHLNYRAPGAEFSEVFSVKEIGYERVPSAFKQILTRNVYIIQYILSGSGLYMGEPFSAGDCFHVVPGEVQIIESDKDSGYESAWIILKGRRSKEILTKCGFPEHNSLLDFGKSLECGDIIKKYLFDREYENGYVESCALEEVFYRLMALHFAEKSEEVKPSHSKASEIAEYIEKNYSSALKIHDLCNIFYLSKNYLCTIFKNEYGVTPQEYLISYRMEKAKQFLLFDGKLQIAEISFSVGIDNPLYFSRCFRKRFGMSPSEFRKKNAPRHS
ncbi:MAG: helix-turn-helix transcriptional regulator [Clostridia bacterium]|nr:helix-turn-helix transcriptional regulator [Clostridia bacterium]